MNNNKKNNRNAFNSPHDIIEDLGPFDLDVCGQPKMFRPWEIATMTFTKEADAMRQVWPRESFAWMHPPHIPEGGYNIFNWVDAFAKHDNGICLINVQAGTRSWQKSIFMKASAIFYLEGNLKYADAIGNYIYEDRRDCALIAFGEKALLKLNNYKGRSGVLFCL